MRKVLKKFSVEWLQVLDEKGKADAKLMPKLSKEDILKIYEHMVVTRVFDDKAFKLQRQGRLGTYAQSLGQEASQVGSAYALQQDDWTFPSFREHGVFVVRNMPLAKYLQYWSGDQRGMHIPENMNMFTVAIPVSTQIPHAVGMAWAMKIKKKKSAVVVYFGDGATSRGDFHEAMNFAGVFKVPCVFICQNNQWAISVPVARQTAAATLAQKAIAYGFDGVRVDGNDVFAVYRATKEALEKARAGSPTLIECLTYRMGDHTTSDDAKRYRNATELAEWQKKDPIARLEKYMLAKKILTNQLKEKIWAEAATKVDSALKEFEAIPAPQPEDMFKNVYSKLPAGLEEQMEEAKENQADTKKPQLVAEKDDKDVGVAQ